MASDAIIPSETPLLVRLKENNENNGLGYLHLKGAETSSSRLQFLKFSNAVSESINWPSETNMRGSSFAIILCYYYSTVPVR